MFDILSFDFGSQLEQDTSAVMLGYLTTHGFANDLGILSRCGPGNCDRSSFFDPGVEGL